MTVLFRLSYRIYSLRSGLSAALAQQEVPYMICEGVMVAIAVVALTYTHPALRFQELWTPELQVELYGVVDKVAQKMGLEHVESAPAH